MDPAPGPSPYRPSPDHPPPAETPASGGRRRWLLVAGVLAVALMIGLSVLALLTGRQGVVIGLGLLVTLAVTGLYALFVRAGG